MDPAERVHQAFLDRVQSGELPDGDPPRGPLDADTAITAFRAQCLSRALDLQSRKMQRRGTGFYTIGSSGHEGMAALALVLETTDPAFLHYRDAAFQIARGFMVSGQDPARDLLLSFACAADDPISGGRHKVLGSKALMIPPQTSTIASHLPKALGAAFSIALARRHKPEHQAFPDDAIVLCSFGDASLNHSTAQGALNASGWTQAQSTPLPLLFVCEDNGIGISVKTPKGWVEASMSARPGLKYFKANGLDLYETYRVAARAVDYVRRHRRPAFLHLAMVRLLGHAGADVASTYLERAEIEADEARDPLVNSVRLLRDAGAMQPAEAAALYTKTCSDVAALAEKIENRPRLSGAAEVMASLIPPKRDCQLPSGSPKDALPDENEAASPALSLARAMNLALGEALRSYPDVVMMGQDIGRKGGVYGVTQKLMQRFGPGRVVDTLLDEQSILGLAIGMAHNGFTPVPEIQFLAYLHNAEDQLRGEAATLPFFSNGQFSNPMVIRVAGLGYQKGFGGHFHNDNSVAVLRDIPGVIIACPSRPGDAVSMFRECLRLAREEQRVVVFLEPIALYQTRDLLAPGDGLWASEYPSSAERAPLGDVAVSGEGRDVAIITYGNGHYLSLQAQADLRDTHGIDARVVDMRWIAPVPDAALRQATKDADGILIIDECRRTGGQAEALMAMFAEDGRNRVARLTAEDSFISTGPSYGATLPSRDSIVAAARDLLKRS